MENLFFLGGMPRTGSNLLCSILNQNQKIYASGISPIEKIISESEKFFKDSGIEQDFLILNQDVEEFKSKIYKNFFNSYYEKQKERFIIDKNFSWVYLKNLKLIKKYINNNPKIIITERDLFSVSKSLKHLYINNGFSDAEAENKILNLDGKNRSGLISLYLSILIAKIKNGGEFLFIDYDSVLFNPKENIKKIYNHLGISQFDHNLENISIKYSENPSLILKGSIEVRPAIEKRKIDLDFSLKAIKKIETIADLGEKYLKTKDYGSIYDMILEFS